MAIRTRAQDANPWLKEVQDFVRALGGAYLFGIPLLYTLEMWSIGVTGEPGRLAVFLALAFALNLVLAYFSGFKHKRTFIGNLEEAVEALAVGVVAGTVMLVVLNRLRWGDPWAASLGMIIVQAVPLSLGAAIANTLFSRPDREEGDPAQQPAAPASIWSALLNDVGATLAGGVFIGFSIAPTDEVGVLASELDLAHALALMVFSCLLSYAIVFTSLHTDEAAHGRGLPFQHPFTETALAYGLSLAVAFVILLLFNQIELGDPLHNLLHHVVVLGLPVTVGGAAGRVII
jgi:putative integral membrane protein (TIGR02587 family)